MSDTAEHNKQLVRRFYDEVENQGRLEVTEELFTADFRDVYNSSSPFPVVGIDGVKKLATALKEHLGLHITIEDLIAEGDRVVARISSTSTPKVPVMGVDTGGRSFSGQGVEIFRVAGGKLAERWVFIDRVPLMKELGVFPG
jgi:predicted ester cyclase